MLSGRQHAIRVRELLDAVPLEPVDRRLHLDDQRRVLAEALVGSAPTVVLCSADTRSEDPLRARRPGLLAGDVLDPRDQRWVARCAQADVVREDCCAQHVPVTVHGVDAVQDRNVQARGQRRGLERVDHVGPSRRRPGRRRREPASGCSAAAWTRHPRADRLDSAG